MKNFDNSSEISPDKREQFIIKVNDFKQSMGLWYSLLALRIIPFILYIVPINIILTHLYTFLQSNYIPKAQLGGPFLIVSTVVALLGFVAITVFAPKAATVIEFIIGGLYLFFAFKHHLFNTLLGYSVLISLILFLIVKFVFLVFKIISIKEFANDKKNNIERDESGRVVRAVEEEVFFTKEDEYLNNNVPQPATDDEVFFLKDDNSNTYSEYAPATDDDFFFVKDYNPDEGSETAPIADDDYFFG